MSYEIKDRLSLKVVFNDDEFLFGRVNSLDFIHMVASTRIGVPMLHMALQDNVGFLSETKHLADAARIQIVVAARANSKSNTYVFRLNSYKRTPNSGGHRYEIDAYPDCSTYWHASQQDPVSGTSYSALSQIASTCGLNFSGDQTADQQVWLPSNTQYHEWARLISERGFRSDTSCMQLGMNIDRSLVYRDLSNDVLPSVQLYFGGYKDGFVMISDAVPTTAAGSMNHFSGYADRMVEQDLSAAPRTNDSVNVNLKAGEGSLQINPRVKRAVQRSSVRFAPIDPGNVHSEYERALYQNRRLNNLFTSRLEVVTPEPTALSLLDVVSVTMEGNQDYLRSYSGNYRLASRVIRVQGNEYFEKFELLRKTITESSS